MRLPVESIQMCLSFLFTVLNGNIEVGQDLCLFRDMPFLFIYLFFSSLRPEFLNVQIGTQESLFCFVKIADRKNNNNNKKKKQKKTWSCAHTNLKNISRAFESLK